MLVSTLKFVCDSGSKGSDLLLTLAAAASIGDRLPGRTSSSELRVSQFGTWIIRLILVVGKRPC
jgi:hypothetical protein